ncbi:MAG: AAA family ATPase [Saprospiraceae bacterium]|nr:AAA family ATPase [Saprospiraceae bacterium]
MSVVENITKNVESSTVNTKAQRRVRSKEEKIIKRILLSQIVNFKDVRDSINLENHFSDIKNGKSKDEIEEIRRLKKLGKRAEADLIKKKLPSVTPNGVFKERSNNTPPEIYSQVIAIDVDKLTEQNIKVDELRKELALNKYVLSTHLSCGGDGLVIWIHHNAQVKDHLVSVEQVSDYFEKKYSIKTDRKVSKGINSLRYVSFDPKLYLNWDAEEFTIMDGETYRLIKEQENFTMKRESLEAGNRNNFLFQFACNCKRAGIEAEDLIAFAIIHYEDKDFNSKEIKNTIKSGFKAEEPIAKQKKAKNLSRIKGPGFQAMKATEEFLKKRKREDIKLQEPIFSQNGVPLIFPNSIVLLQGKHGSHKSRVAASFASAGLNDTGCGTIPLGLEVTKEGMHVVYIDTERNLSTQLPIAIQNIQEHACLPREIDPENFSYTSVVNVKRGNRYDAIVEFIQDIRDKVGEEKHLLIVIDVISDLVITFNDPAESLILADYCNDLINSENCTIITVLHENPGKSNEKARGHLGSELANKASTILQVSTVTGVPGTVKVAVQKSRNTAIPEPIYAAYDEATGGLKPIDPSILGLPKASPGLKADLNSVVEYLGNNLLEAKLRKDLFYSMMNHFNCGIRTIEPKISEIIMNNVLIPTVAGDMVLSKEKKSDGVYYLLKEPKRLEAGSTAA